MTDRKPNTRTQEQVDDAAPARRRRRWWDVYDVGLAIATCATTALGIVQLTNRGDPLDVVIGVLLLVCAVPFPIIGWIRRLPDE